MPKDNIIAFPDRMEGRAVNQVQLIQARLDELEHENEYLSGDIEFLSDQLEKNLDEVEELLADLTHIRHQELDTSIAKFNKDFEADIHFEPDFDLEPKE
jgi:hypothetical protein|tara:strand:+ start:364 stop:660 length:297 start_codon:yes stop_codon:yes gene_type:complete